MRIQCGFGMAQKRGYFPQLSEHIDLGIKYDPAIGIYGMDFYVVMSRPGERVARRRRCKTKVGASHKVNPTEVVKWYKNRFEGIVR